MKHFILAALLCISTFGIAQNATTSPRTVTVYGTTVKTSNDFIYKTDVTLSLENNYYADNPCSTIEELEEKYFTELKKLNIDKSKFIKDDLAYAASGYRQNGTIYHFETKSKADILKVVGLKMAQVQPSYVQMKSVITEAEIKELTKKALENARQSADMLAKASGEEVDKVYSVSGNYDLGADAYWRTPNSGEDYFRLTVVYTLKD